MDAKHQEDWLDRQLRQAAPYIDDAGFTWRVLQQLPARGRRRDSLRAVIVLGMALLASALAYVLSEGGRFLVVALARLPSLPVFWLLVLAYDSGLILMAGGVVVALDVAIDLRRQVL